MTTPNFVVLADDRTGAWETAGACADRLGSAVIVSLEQPPTPQSVVVIDLATRHLRPGHAATTARNAAARSWDGPACRLLHKIDSTLRGNWAHEVVSVAASHNLPVMVVASFPLVGRTCRGGVVFDGDRPVAHGAAGHDPRRPVTMSRPADHLRAAGSEHVVELATADAVRRWLADTPRGIAVCDAQTDDDLDALGRVWADHSATVFAGTAASVAAAVGASHPKPAGTAQPRQRFPPLTGPSLVVCGSLHPMARRQLAVLSSEAPNVEIIAFEPPVHAMVTATQARVTAALLAEATHRARSNTTFASVVIIGGDTAAAILGDHERIIEGTIGPGLPWSIEGDSLVVTRPGGFGSERSLIDVFSARMEA